MNSIIHYLVHRGLVVNLVSLFLLAIGLYATLSINREAFPNVNLDKIQIDSVYPGASPGEIEQLVISPIEQELRRLNGIDKMVSMSFPGSGRITLDVDPDSNNRDRLASDVSLAVSRATLPADLSNDPHVTEVEGSVFPVIRLAVSASRDELEMKRLGDKIKDDLLNLEGVAQIVILGERKAEIRIVVDPIKMAQEHISVGEITRVIKAWNVNIPGGDINTPDGQKVVRVVGEFTNAKDAGNLVLRTNARGDVLKLKDVANIRESLTKPNQAYEVGGQPGFTMLILKKTDKDIISTVNLVKEFVDQAKKRYGDDVALSTFQDFSRFARLRLGVLTNNGMVGVILVFISLILFLRNSVAMTTTLGLPIIFMSGLFILFVSGVTLNLISMMGFIMVLGMLVDDAIIIGENITWHMEQGMSPKQAAVTGATELIGPVTATILTTIAAFTPMMFMSGMIGKFIIAIPIVVITLLALSWLESFFILPSHVAHFTNPNKHPPERAWLQKLDTIYNKVLMVAIRFRWTTVGLSFAALFASIILAKTMSFVLFPAAGVDEFVVRVTAPSGTSLNQMQAHLRAIDKKIRDKINPDFLEANLLKTGDVSLDLGDPLTQRGSRYGQIRTIYIPAVSRPQHSVVEQMLEFSNTIPPMFPQLDISFTELKPGPPIGRALEAEISSYDNQASNLAAQRLMAFLKETPGVISVDSGSKQGDEELHIVLDRKLATYAGVDLQTAALHIRAASGGLVVSTVRRGSEEIDVTIRYPERKNALKQLKQIQIPNQRDGLVPLFKIARIVKQPGLTTIRHRDSIRVINVVADVDTQIITSKELNALVAEEQDQWLNNLNGKVNISYGGEEEKNKESTRDLAFSFLFALIGIFFILAIQFNNLSYPIIVMLAIPFGAIGIIISFYFHDMLWRPMPLSFFSMLGMVALTGVVVNSSLILLVFIQRARKSGMEAHKAIIEAGRRRLRAVLLTATTTIVGLLPTAYGWGGMDPFVSPMAMSLSWGLVFATFVTLITIPATLAVALDIRDFFGSMLKKDKQNKLTV